MRGILGRLCHGKPRGPQEPYGTVAPLLRAVTAGLLFVAAVAGLVMTAAIAAGYVTPAVVAMFVAGAAATVAGLARYVAHFTRPWLGLTVWDPESRR